MLLFTHLTTPIWITFRADSGERHELEIPILVVSAYPRLDRQVFHISLADIDRGRPGKDQESDYEDHREDLRGDIEKSLDP